MKKLVSSLGLLVAPFVVSAQTSNKLSGMPEACAKYFDIGVNPESLTPAEKAERARLMVACVQGSTKQDEKFINQVVGQTVMRSQLALQETPFTKEMESGGTNIGSGFFMVGTRSVSVFDANAGAIPDVAESSACLVGEAGILGGDIVWGAGGVGGSCLNRQAPTQAELVPSMSVVDNLYVVPNRSGVVMTAGGFVRSAPRAELMGWNNNSRRFWRSFDNTKKRWSPSLPRFCVRNATMPAARNAPSLEDIEASVGKSGVVRRGDSFDAINAYSMNISAGVNPLVYNLLTGVNPECLDPDFTPIASLVEQVGIGAMPDLDSAGEQIIRSKLPEKNANLLRDYLVVSFPNSFDEQRRAAVAAAATPAERLELMPDIGWTLTDQDNDFDFQTIGINEALGILRRGEKPLKYGISILRHCHSTDDGITYTPLMNSSQSFVDLGANVCADNSVRVLADTNGNAFWDFNEKFFINIGTSTSIPRAVPMRQCFRCEIQTSHCCSILNIMAKYACNAGVDCGGTCLARCVGKSARTSLDGRPEQHRWKIDDLVRSFQDPRMFIPGVIAGTRECGPSSPSDCEQVPKSLRYLNADGSTGGCWDAMERIIQDARRGVSTYAPTCNIGQLSHPMNQLITDEAMIERVVGNFRNMENDWCVIGSLDNPYMCGGPTSPCVPQINTHDFTKGVYAITRLARAASCTQQTISLLVVDGTMPVRVEGNPTSVMVNGVDTPLVGNGITGLKLMEMMGMQTGGPSFNPTTMSSLFCAPPGGSNVDATRIYKLRTNYNEACGAAVNALAPGTLERP
ncbi:MAG: hypothetical protein FWD15_03415 [Alphaproteobacteria bacterium]|nr:hypothetical protein [Alphaproteobacteria bacterium]